MSKFNPDFWEITLAAEGWERFAGEEALWHESAEDARARQHSQARADDLWPEVRAIVDAVLTERQREIVLLYYVEGLNQRQIAERLNTAQQSVSEHLFGKARGGRTVGGALRKLRKVCARRGIGWD